MSLVKKRCALGMMIVLAVLPATAGAAPLRQTGTIAFGTFGPASPTSLSESATYRNPDDPNAKPPAVRRIVVRYPAGFRIDTSVPGQCHASDQQLETGGGGACPSDSRVGSGDTDLATGFPGPAPTFQLDLEVYNNRDRRKDRAPSSASGARRWMAGPSQQTFPQRRVGRRTDSRA